MARARFDAASAAALAELPDGKLLVGGMAWTDGTDDVLLVARYNADGTLDTSFGSGGVEMIDVSQTQYESIYAMAVQPDGKVILAGSLYDELADSLGRRKRDITHYAPAARRALTAMCNAGSLDTDMSDRHGPHIIPARLSAAFALSGQTQTGWTTVDFGFGTELLRALDVTAGGDIVLGGKWGNYSIVARLLSDGTLDTSFHEDGKLTLSGGVYVEINDLLVEPDGRIVLGGLSIPGPGINFCLMIGRLNADGTTDTSFGVSGWRQVDTDATEWADERVLALARQADGRIIAAGYTQAGELTLARLSGLTRHYAMQDANWTITGIINPETGQPVERYVFTPYGGRTVLDSAFESRSTSSFGWIVGHQGLAVDVETGLIYNRARYLDTGMGRFTIRDPLGYVDGMNAHEYVRSRPLVRRDSTGLVGETIGWPDWVRDAPSGPNSPVTVAQIGDEWQAFPPARPTHGTDVDYRDSRPGGATNCLQWAFNCHSPSLRGHGRPNEADYQDPKYPAGADYQDIVGDPVRFGRWLDGYLSSSKACATGYRIGCSDCRKCPPGWHKIAAFSTDLSAYTWGWPPLKNYNRVISWYDYHFITQDDDGTWSEVNGMKGHGGNTDIINEGEGGWKKTLVGCWCVNTPPRKNVKVLQDYAKSH